MQKIAEMENILQFLPVVYILIWYIVIKFGDLRIKQI